MNGWSDPISVLLFLWVLALFTVVYREWRGR